MAVFYIFLLLSCGCLAGLCSPLHGMNPIPKELTPRASSYSTPQYLSHATSALAELQILYNTTSGLWETTGWWNNANIVTMLAVYALVNSQARVSTIPIFQNTLTQAAQSQPQEARIVSQLTSTNTFEYPDIPGGVALPDPKLSNGFLNAYYEDEGWWALAWLKVYDLTGDNVYMNNAIGIFNDMTQGYPAKCGGIWWDKNQTASTAITNELFLTVAAQLANRAANRNYYLQWALTQWHWFEGSGLINAQKNINDGIDLSTCTSNDGLFWSYNYGVIIGGLLELYQANANSTYITIAENIAIAAMAELSDSRGILQEKCEPNCGSDAPQFKGIFMRNLQYLQQASPNDTYKDFVQNNADAIWSHDQGSNQTLGLTWSGPPGQVTAATQSSALDALVAVVAVG